jgi:hypothetical protein
VLGAIEPITDNLLKCLWWAKFIHFLKY